MNHARQVEVLKEIFRHIDAGTTPMAAAPYWNPVERYTGQAHFDTELRTLFDGRLPLLAGFTPDLPAPGHWFTYDMPDAPLLIVRDRGGKARAFLNICRHRGSRLVGFEMGDDGKLLRARGSTPAVLACPYHGWAYDLQGALVRHANDMGGFAAIEAQIARGAFNLQELPCVETDGMILVRPHGNKPIEVEGDTYGMHRRMGEFGFGKFHLYQEVFADFGANWKLLMDTFMEGYHIASLHHSTLAPRFRCYPVVSETFGPHALFPLTRKSITDQRALPESEWSVLRHASTVFVVSPNAILNIPMDGHMELWDFRPLTVGSTRVRVRFYIPTEVRTEEQRTLWQKSWKVSTDVIFREDFVQQQNIQANLASGRIQGIVFGSNEPMLTHFHRELGRLTGVADAVMPG